MADHSKTDSNVPLPDPDVVERTVNAALEKMRARRGYYITIGILALVAVVAFFVFVNMSSEEGSTEFATLWNLGTPVRSKLRRDTSAREELALFEGRLADFRGRPEEGLALWMLGTYYYAEANTSDKTTFELKRPALEKAIGFLKELQESRFDEMLLAKPRWFTEDTQPPIDVLYRQAKADLEWEKQHAKPAPSPDDDVVAVLRTSEGDIHLKFFKKLAPKHVETFVTLATTGTYNGTLFHFVRGGNEEPISVMGGDPYTFFYPKATKKRNILRWGHGGLGVNIPPEEARFKVLHQRAIVTSQRTADADWDNAVQFQIMIQPDRTLDRVHTPFATVVEGMNVVERIAKRKTASQFDAYKDDNDFASVQTSDLIVEPVEIHKVIVFKGGKAVEHKFELKEGEQSLASLSGSPAAPIAEEALYGGRLLRPSEAEGEPRFGLDFPYPNDVKTDDESSPPNPKGDRETEKPG
jgi:cyclophilin family peptidyl-prolyl cis-trans isomerase